MLRKKRGLVVSVVVSIVMMFAMVLPAFADTTVRVDPTNMHGWVFVNDETNGPGSGDFVNGPGTPPLGTGSMHFVLTGASDGQIAALPDFLGTKLSALTTLKYSTYQSVTNPSNATAIALQFNVDKDVTDADNSYQGRIVYEPYNNNGGTVPQGTWNQWDGLNSGNAKWWLSHSSTQFDNNCPQSSPCTLSHIISLYPNIGIHPTLGAVILKAGSGWSAFDGNADELIIGVSGTNTTYDFEHNPLIGPPTTLLECKKDGWQTFNNPSFDNQGQCIKYVREHAHAILGDVSYNAYGLDRKAQFSVRTDTDGAFMYTDQNHNWYKVIVTSAKVNGQDGWFAGKVWQASNPSWVGQWLFVKVNDSNPNEIWGVLRVKQLPKQEF